VLIRKACEVKISSEKRFSITQHITSDKHECGVKCLEFIRDEKALNSLGVLIYFDLNKMYKTERNNV